MKKKLLLSLVMLMAIVGLAACGGGGAVVKSDQGDVTKDELYDALKDKDGEQVLQLLTFNKILDDKYKVSDKEVDKKYNAAKAQYGEQFASALQQANLTEKMYKLSLKNELLRQKATKAYIKVTDKKLQDYYKTWQPKITVSHILVADKKTADKVEQELKDGKKFADLAKKYSTDTASKTKGGKLDAFGTGQMDPAFEKAAYALKEKGDISKPVKSQFGYHVIQLDEPAKKATFEKDKAQVKKDYIDSQMNNAEVVQAALKKEFKDANVKVEDKDLKDAFSQFTSKTK